MRFARSAERYSEQNLIVRQDRGQLYFTSTRTINPRQELRVWYSPEYAEARGLKVLRPSPEDLGKFCLDYLFICNTSSYLGQPWVRISCFLMVHKFQKPIT